MSVNKNLAIAALTGLMSITFLTPTFAADNNGDTAVKAEKTESATEKHACKGMNSCKGNSPDGKNACKGKSACATDKEASGDAKEKHSCKGQSSCASK